MFLCLLGQVQKHLQSAPANTYNYSMTLHTLTLHDISGEAGDNAGMDAPPQTPVEQLRQERVAHAVTRAGAEQARRIADCVRTGLDTLLLHLDQPCAVVDRNGTVTRWNDSLAELSGISVEQAVGQNLQILLHLPADHALTRALCALTPDVTYKPQTSAARVLRGPLSLLPDVHAANITLIPLCRVPGSLEAVIVLVRPA